MIEQCSGLWGVKSTYIWT